MLTYVFILMNIVTYAASKIHLAFSLNHLSRQDMLVGNVSANHRYVHGWQQQHTWLLSQQKQVFL